MSAVINLAIDLNDCLLGALAEIDISFRSTDDCSCSAAPESAIERVFISLAEDLDWRGRFDETLYCSQSDVYVCAVGQFNRDRS